MAEAEKRIRKAQADAIIESLVHRHPELRELLDWKDQEITRLKKRVCHLIRKGG